MINCNKTKKQISLYIDDMLDCKERTRFEHHIEKCGLCRSELDKLTGIVNMCKDIPDEDIPENFKQQLHNKLINLKDEGHRKGNIVFLRNRYIKVCSTIAAGILIVFLMKTVLYDGLELSKMDNYLSMESVDEASIEFEREKKSIRTQDDSIYNGSNSEAIYKSDSQTAEEAQEADIESGSMLTMAGQNSFNGNIKITVDINEDNDEKVDGIKNLIVDNNGVLEDRQQEADINHIILFEFIISNKNYEGFVNSLQEYLGWSNVIVDTADAVDTNDTTKTSEQPGNIQPDSEYYNISICIE